MTNILECIFSFYTFIILLIALKTISTACNVYIKYKLSILYDTCTIFKFICIYHVESARASRIFSIDERNSMLYSINKNINLYKLGVDASKLSKYKLSVEDNIDEFISLLKMCDDLNYITVQTTAHELEYMAWFLIVEKIKIYKMISTLNAFRILGP